MRCRGCRVRRGADAAADPSADAAAEAAAVLRSGRRRRHRAGGKAQGCEGCEANARVPHGTNSHAAHPTRYLKVVQFAFRRKARATCPVKNHIDDCLFRIATRLAQLLSPQSLLSSPRRAPTKIADARPTS